MREVNLNFVITNNDNGTTSIQRRRTDPKAGMPTGRTKEWNSRVRNEQQPFITVKQYENAIYRYEKKLKVDLINHDYKVLMLPTNIEMDYFVFQAEVKKFIANFRYEYKDTEYINAIECYENGFNRFHSHLLVIFKDKAPAMNEKWLKDHWGFGKVVIRDPREFEESDAIRYLTKYKWNNVQDENPKLTKFPQFAKFVSTSRNLPKANITSQENVDYKTAVNTANTLLQQQGAKVNKRTHFHDNNVYFDGATIYNVDNSKSLGLKDDNLLFEDFD